MGVQAIRSSVYLPRPPSNPSAAPTINSSAAQVGIDAADEKVASIFQAPKSGSIRKIYWALGVVTTGATVDVRVESVNGAGEPSGVLQSTDSNAAVVVDDSNDFTKFATQLTADAVVSRGEIIAVVISNPSVSFGNMIIGAAFDDDSTGMSFPYGASFTGGAWTKRQGGRILALGYSDGSVEPIPCVWPMWSAFLTYNVSTGSSPARVANRFQLPFDAYTDGAWVWVDGDNEFKVDLIGPDGATILASTLTVGSGYRVSNAGGVYFLLFDATAQVKAGQSHWLSVVPQTGGTLAAYAAQTLWFPESRDAWDLSTAMCLSHAGIAPSGQSSWTDVEDQRLFIGLHLTGFSVSDAVPFRSHVTGRRSM